MKIKINLRKCSLYCLQCMYLKAFPTLAHRSLSLFHPLSFVLSLCRSCSQHALLLRHSLRHFTLTHTHTDTHTHSSLITYQLCWPDAAGNVVHRECFAHSLCRRRSASPQSSAQQLQLQVQQADRGRGSRARGSSSSSSNGSSDSGSQSQ